MANPNPSPETRFAAGERANPQGKTSEQKRREMRNAEMATKLRERMLEAEIARMTDPSYVPQLDANLRAFIKDSEDRGLGSPTTTLAGDPDNPVGITTVRRLIVGHGNGEGNAGQ